MMNRNAISSPSAKDIETKAIRTSSLELKLSLTADEKEKEEWNDYTRAVNKYATVLWTHTADMLASHVEGV